MLQFISFGIKCVTPNVSDSLLQWDGPYGAGSNETWNRHELEIDRKMFAQHTDAQQILIIPLYIHLADYLRRPCARWS